MVEESIELLIKSACISNNKTLSEILDEIGIVKNTYYKIKRGGRPSNRVYAKLASYFNKSGMEIYKLPLNEEQRLSNGGIRDVY